MERRVTCRARQISVELLNDGRETTAGHVEKLPRPLHGRDVVPSARPLRLLRNVAVVRTMVKRVLDQSLELERVREKQNGVVLETHGRVGLSESRA
jgi:hypothetical protein